jgi:hypothetical protein
VGAKDPRTNPGADPRATRRSFAPLGPTHPSLRMTLILDLCFTPVVSSLMFSARFSSGLRVSAFHWILTKFASTRMLFVRLKTSPQRH